MRGKTFRINGGRGDHQLQIMSAWTVQQPLQVAQQEIDIETALVGLVNDQGVILPQKWITLTFGE